MRKGLNPRLIEKEWLTLPCSPLAALVMVSKACKVERSQTLSLIFAYGRVRKQNGHFTLYRCLRHLFLFSKLLKPLPQWFLAPPTLALNMLHKSCLCCSHANGSYVPLTGVEGTCAAFILAPWKPCLCEIPSHFYKYEDNLE